MVGAWRRLLAQTVHYQMLLGGNNFSASDRRLGLVDHHINALSKKCRGAVAHQKIAPPGMVAAKIAGIAFSHVRGGRVRVAVGSSAAVRASYFRIQSGLGRTIDK